MAAVVTLCYTVRYLTTEVLKPMPKESILEIENRFIVFIWTDALPHGFCHIPPERRRFENT